MIELNNIEEEECRQLGGKLNAGVCYLPHRKMTAVEQILKYGKQFIKGLFKNDALISIGIGASLSGISIPAIAGTCILNGITKVRICHEIVEEGKKVLKSTGDYKKIKALAEKYQFAGCGDENEYWNLLLSE